MIVLATIALFVIAVLWEGIVLSVLWGWFMAPAFQLPPLSIPYAIGLALLVGLLTSKVRKSEDHPEMVEILTHGLATPLVFLVVGWIVKAFT